MKTHVLSARNAAVALTCAVALVSLTACNNGGDAAESAAGSTPSKTAEASPAADSNGIEKLSAKEIYDTGMKTNAQAGSFHEKMEREGTKSDLRLSATECVGTVDISEKGESVTWYVASTGKPYFIKQDSTRDDMQDLTDSDFGGSVGAKAPSGEVVEAPAA